MGTHTRMGFLDGKVAIVTGAGGGIGRAHARLFAKEGAKVVVNDLGGPRDGSGKDTGPAGQVTQEIQREGGTATANTDNVATVEGATALVKAAVDSYGRVDILVNNAGILRDKSFLKMDEGMWDAVVAVHLKGTFLCSQVFAKQVVAQGGGGRVVNTTSVSGMLGNFGQANYSAAKAGIYGLTRTMSIELQKHRITVNAIAPIAKTRMTEDLPMFQGVDTLTPEHIAPAALFLASDLCGDRTGHVLAVAGARMYAFKVVETAGRFKESDATGVWTAQEIAESWDAIVKV
jgi:NAD(P)-dependent dehydrogenase (short-subunit alcohol dehydrogenase family)